MKPLFVILFTLIGFSVSAQTVMIGESNSNNNKPQVTWKFAATKVGNKYTIEATAKLENGWHVFTSDPGGDGSLTPTQIEVNEIAKLKVKNEFSQDGEMVEKDMEGIGSVRYYVNQASFRISFELPTNIKTFTGNISYQICNEVMCMAPATQTFSVTVK